MINQDQMTNIILKELREFDLSRGWIDPDECYKYEEYETNYNGDFFEVTDMCLVSIESSNESYFGGDVSLDSPVNIVVKEFESWEDWENYHYNFEIPNLLCLQTKKLFTEEFKKAIIKTNEDIRIETIKGHLSSLQYLSKEQILDLEGSDTVDLRFGVKHWSCEVIGSNKD